MTTHAMHLHSTLFNTVALCIMTCLASSATVASDRHLSTFEQISSPDFGKVNSILRDDRGFLWFGTDRGLFKFDGYQVRGHAIGPTLTDKQQIVTSMIRMDSASLLLATGRGLWAFNLSTEQSSPFLPGTEISESRINAVIVAPDGTMWIGTNSLGLFSYNPTTATMQRYTTSNGLSSNGILSLLLDRSGTLWVGTLGGGLNGLDMSTSRFVHYRSNTTDRGTLLSDNVIALCENDSQELWIGTSEGLNVLNLGTRRMVRMDLHSYTKHNIMAIVHDASGRMWIAALDLGVLLYSKGSFTPFTALSDVGRSLSAVRTLYPDPIATTGNSLLLWIGTRNGVNKVLMLTNPFTNHIRYQDSLYLDRGAVLSLREDRDGILWTGLWGGGLDMLRRTNGSYQRVANFKHNPTDPSSLPHNDVSSIVEDRNGNLWIGTAGGLAKLDVERKGMVVYKHQHGDPASLAHNDVGGTYEDRSGTIWICTRGGLSELLLDERSHFKNYLNDPKEAHPVEGNFVSDILEDRHSHLWTATYGRGLNKLEANGTFSRFLHPGDSSGTQENWIFCLVEDHNGLFWLSTLAGLVSFDPQSAKFTRYPIPQLRGAHVFGIHIDKRNDLWLSTGIGLIRFSPRTHVMTRFDESDGIAFTELRSGFFKDTREKLFVGGLDGFTEFYPDSISENSHPPEIAVTAVSVFDKYLPASILTSRDIRLPHDQNSLSFSFAALDYAKPQQNRFAYRMVGVDNDWVEAGTRNYASYANLDPGRYVFEIRGCNSNGVWNESGTAISIAIAPPYWQTWWFRVLVAGIVVSMMYTAYRYRLKKLLELERLRLRIANDLHDDVGSNLSAIAMVSRAAQRAPELTQSTKRRIAEIYDTAVSTSEGMKDLVWFIKPEDDTLDDLFLRMRDTASTLLGEIPVDFHAPKTAASVTIAIDFKRNVFLAFKEILANITKHAMATRVEIHITLHAREFEMIIRDNGKGFDETTRHRGNGLLSLRKRASSIGGSCKIASAPGQGTTVNFTGRF